MFSFTGNVYADKNYLKEKTNDLYSKCNEKNNCIPLCIYSSTDKDSVGINSEKAYIDERAYIGYYINDNKWEIGAMKGDNILYTFSDTKLPKSDIFWEDLGEKGNKTWNETEAYKELESNLKCPAYINIDYSGTSVELCFANSANKCKEQGSWNPGTNFYSDHPIKYSFGDSLKKVIDETYNALRVDDNSSEDAKVKFLHDADPDNITYDSSKSGKENAEANCEFIKSKMEDQKGYINKLVGNSEDFNVLIDSKLKENASTIDTRNTSIYNIKDLGSILNKKEMKDSEGTLYSKKLSDIYTKSVLSSMRYYGEVCGFEFDEAKFIDETREVYETKTYNLPNIDIDSKFDCSTISGISDLISTGYFVIEIIALILLVGLTVLDYAKVIMSGEQDEMKKSNKRLLTRIIIAALILLLPMLINLILGVFHIEGIGSGDPTDPNSPNYNPLCVEIKNK